MQLLLIFCLFLLLIELQMKINISCWWKMIFFFGKCLNILVLVFHLLLFRIHLEFCQITYVSNTVYMEILKNFHLQQSWGDKYIVDFIWNFIHSFLDRYMYEFFYILQRFMCFYFFSRILLHLNCFIWCVILIGFWLC